MSSDPLLLEVALVWVHLPSGAAAVQGVVRHPDGGPMTGGSAVADRPVGAGGTEVLAQAAPPATEVLSPGAQPPVHLLSSDPAGWAVTGPEAAQAEAERRGWRLVSRAEAARVLSVQGYRLRDSTAPGHVLHTDQADDLTWHPRQGPGGRRSPFILAAFATRPVRVPDSPASLPRPRRAAS